MFSVHLGALPLDLWEVKSCITCFSCACDDYITVNILMLFLLVSGAWRASSFQSCCIPLLWRASSFLCLFNAVVGMCDSLTLLAAGHLSKHEHIWISSQLQARLSSVSGGDNTSLHRGNHLIDNWTLHFLQLIPWSLKK